MHPEITIYVLQIWHYIPTILFYALQYYNIYYMTIVIIVCRNSDQSGTSGRENGEVKTQFGKHKTYLGKIQNQFGKIWKKIALSVFQIDFLICVHIFCRIYYIFCIIQFYSLPNSVSASPFPLPLVPYWSERGIELFLNILKDVCLWILNWYRKARSVHSSFEF